MPFSKFNFSPKLLASIEENGFKKPTKIQEEVIPHILENEDLLVQAQTGSGKTACFVLPIIQKIQSSSKSKKAKIKALILTPTRELTLQVSTAFKDFSKSLKIVSLIGGQSLGDQLLEIQKGCDVVVATSGRLLDILSKKQMNLDSLEFFVLDEADRMLNDGFKEELDSILKQIPQKRQNLLFSATYPQKIQSEVFKITSNAKKIKIEEELVVKNINQRVIKVNKENRSSLLRHLIKENDFKSVIVFMATKRACENLAHKFRKYGFEAESFHANLEQEERNLTLEDFKENHIEILFSTDIASRGLHIDDIQCVVNYDLPRSPSNYVHRIGRTARIGKDGVAISFIDYEDFDHFKLIEKRANISLQKEEIQGFELIGEMPKKKKGSAPIKGKRKSKKDKLREQLAKKE